MGIHAKLILLIYCLLFFMSFLITHNESVFEIIRNVYLLWYGKILNGINS